jgi:hypothetical protein
MVGSAIGYALLLSLFLGGLAVRRWWRPQRRRYFQRATIAYDAGPLIDERMVRGSQLWITGADGLPIHKQDYVWHGYLDKWLAKGVHISYVLVCPSQAALNRLMELKTKHGSDRLNIYCLNPDRMEDGPDRETVKKMETFHFLLGDQPKLMWLERRHIPGTVIAEDCEFLKPELAAVDQRYNELKKVYDHIVSKYGQVVEQSNPQKLAV